MVWQMLPWPKTRLLLVPSSIDCSDIMTLDLIFFVILIPAFFLLLSCLIYSPCFCCSNGQCPNKQGRCFWFTWTTNYKSWQLVPLMDTICSHPANFVGHFMWRRMGCTRSYWVTLRNLEVTSCVVLEYLSSWQNPFSIYLIPFQHDWKVQQQWWW